MGRRGRSPCCEKVGLNKGSWTPAEDFRLVAYIRKYGHGNWRALPKLAGLSRCGKSCRLRWINYLRPDIKRGNFTKEEEDTIIKLHHLLGNKWSKIASVLPGRTDNEIKNVWNTHLKKRVAPTKEAAAAGDSDPSPESSSCRAPRASPTCSNTNNGDSPNYGTTGSAEKIAIPSAANDDVMSSMLEEADPKAGTLDLSEPLSAIEPELLRLLEAQFDEPAAAAAGFFDMSSGVGGDGVGEEEEDEEGKRWLKELEKELEFCDVDVAGEEECRRNFSLNAAAGGGGGEEEAFWCYFLMGPHDDGGPPHTSTTRRRS